MVGPIVLGGDDAIARRSHANAWAGRIGGDATDESAGRYRFVNNTFVRASDAGTPPGSAVFRCFDALESVEMHNHVFYSVAGGGGLRILRDLEADCADFAFPGEALANHCRRRRPYNAVPMTPDPR